MPPPTLFPGAFWCALTALAVSACRNPELPPAPKPNRDLAPPPSAAPSQPLVAPSAAPASLPPPPLPDGCTTALPSDPDAEPRLAALGQACAPAMQPLVVPPLVVGLGSGESQSLPFTVTDASRCLRAGATGSRGIDELELEVLDTSGHVLGADRLRGPVALANPDGPICVGSAGSYRAVVRVTQGSGRVALQVWQAR